MSWLRVAAAHVGRRCHSLGVSSGDRARCRRRFRIRELREHRRCWKPVTDVQARESKDSPRLAEGTRLCLNPNQAEEGGHTGQCPLPSPVQPCPGTVKTKKVIGVSSTDLMQNRVGVRGDPYRGTPMRPVPTGSSPPGMGDVVSLRCSPGERHARATLHLQLTLGLLKAGVAGTRAERRVGGGHRGQGEVALGNAMEGPWGHTGG